MNLRLNRNLHFFVLLLFIVNKLIILAAAGLATKNMLQEISLIGYVKYLLIDIFFAWDSGWYENIVEQGYTFKSSAFFPLYPILLYLGKNWLSLSVPDAGLLISNLAFIGMLFFAYKLLLLDYKEKEARRIMWLIALYPTSYYFTAVYTESLFLLLVVLTLYMIRKQNWGVAAVGGFFTSITRNTGVFLTIPFALEYLGIRTWQDLAGFFRNIGTRFKAIRWRGFFWVFLIPLSFFAYMGYLVGKFGDPFAFSHAQPLYGRDVLNPFVTLYRGYIYNLQILWQGDLNWLWVYYFVEFFTVSLVLLVLIGSIRKIRLSYWVMILYSFFIPLCAPATGQVVDYFVSFSRYSLVIFPLYIGLYELIKSYRWLYIPVILLFAILLAVLSYQWSLGQWVA